MVGILLLPVILFLPGFLITKLLGNSGDLIEVGTLSLSFSFIILVLVGLFLHVFSAITVAALWIVYGLIVAFLTAAVALGKASS